MFYVRCTFNAYIFIKEQKKFFNHRKKWKTSLRQSYFKLQKIWHVLSSFTLVRLACFYSPMPCVIEGGPAILYRHRGNRKRAVARTQRAEMTNRVCNEYWRIVDTISILLFANLISCHLTRMTIWRNKTGSFVVIYFEITTSKSK